MVNDSVTEYPKSAADWFYMSPSKLNPNLSWPWPLVNVSDMTEMLVYLENYRKRTRVDVADTLLWVFTAVGLLGGVLIVLTIGCMPKASRTAFYKVMYAIGFFDLAFLLFKVARKRLVLLTPSMVVYVFMFLSCGTVYMFSLMSDMMTLALSVERFVALSWPTAYRQASHSFKRRCWIGAVLVSLLFSLTRSRYAFANSSYRIAAIADTTFFEYVSYFSDTVIPFLLAVLMLLLVVGILRVIVKRVLSKAAMGTQTQANAQKHMVESMRTMSLLSVLMAMFLLNQGGYVYYEICYIALNNAEISFYGDLARVKQYERAVVNFEVSTDVSTLAEVVSRSLLFYKYMIFSAQFRMYFLQMCRYMPRDQRVTIVRKNIPSGSIMHTNLDENNRLKIEDVTSYHA